MISRVLKAGDQKQLKSNQKLLEEINAYEQDLEELSMDELKEMLDESREAILETGNVLLEAPIVFAITREASKRTMNMRHYDVQMLGGLAIAQGSIAQMKTGEGKTLTSTLPIVLHALRGEGVHVVTVNEYLAERDAEWMTPLYKALGLTVGVAKASDYKEKQAAYAKDITYATHSELAFDYLRDNLARNKVVRVQRPAPFAMVDEIDNILIDEARTPLIISGEPIQAGKDYIAFSKLVKTLVKGKRPKAAEFDRNYEPDFDYETDEKDKSVGLTEQGIEKAEKWLGIENLFVAENGEKVNFLIQALRAKDLYIKDKDYAVVNGEIAIIDEYTGRILDGRRWSDGLHQSVEAKEGVPILEETQTIAKTTYQNFFRGYPTLSGMTGTAMTEAVEFMKIYGLRVVDVPSHKPLARTDADDLLFLTKQAKFQSIADEVVERHGKGQPVLVGTGTIEDSEIVSRFLQAKGIKHSVLNAKPEYAEIEAQIVARAGEIGAVTIATNMAGRGVDIRLGGSSEYRAHDALAQTITTDAPDWPEQYQQELAKQEQLVRADNKKVKELGGLCVLATERHESRRIDDQLRGRSGRQGDPGYSRFYVAAEDELLRLYASDRVYKFVESLGIQNPDGTETPLSAKTISKQIARAQSKVEERNFLERKKVLEYDDVISEQRKVVYGLRDRVIDEDNHSDGISSDFVHFQIEKTVDDLATSFLVGDFPETWDQAGFREELHLFCPMIEIQDLQFKEQLGKIKYQIREAYAGQEQKLKGAMSQVEKQVLLPILDNRWKAHLTEMENLKEGIHLRSIAQVDPLVAYKNDGFDMFKDMLSEVWFEFARYLFHAEVKPREEVIAEDQAQDQHNQSQA